ASPIPSDPDDWIYHIGSPGYLGHECVGSLPRPLVACLSRGSPGLGVVWLLIGFLLFAILLILTTMAPDDTIAWPWWRSLLVVCISLPLVACIIGMAMHRHSKAF
ncbi:unnamed protein product, partial [Protopolystoma xenopodis]